jgi:hypothetical protein
MTRSVDSYSQLNPAKAAKGRRDGKIHSISKGTPYDQCEDNLTEADFF